MKKTIYGIMIITVLALGLAGCGGSGGGGGEVAYSGTVYYNDGTKMGVTKQEPIVNGGYSIYDINSGEQIGFITVDGKVNDIDGRVIGICEGATISEDGVLGECTVRGDNPVPTTPTTPTPTTPTTPTPTPEVTISVSVSHESRTIYKDDYVSWFSTVVTKNTSKAVTYNWTVTGKPSGSSASFGVESKQRNPTLYVDLLGTYKVKLVATVDGKSSSATGTLTAISQ